ncbi:MAG: hypothetical protein Q8O84_04490 [Nanoarchaeota archaeon]|nr:hypothetical protein [Nanoarchaeota archaeon]
MNKSGLIKKITQKKEFSQLPEKDIEIAFSHFEKRQVSDEEKIRLIRELLHKVFGAFTSQKLLSPKNKSEEWILRKHLSTRERLGYYENLYRRLLKNFETKNITIIDLGAGVNGFSYKYFQEKVDYTAIESIGQLVGLMNNYFKKENLSAKAIHESLFELEKIKKIITEWGSFTKRTYNGRKMGFFFRKKETTMVEKTKNARVIFLFKVLDSLEMLESDYSKKLLKEIVPLADKVVISFATRSMIKRKHFLVNRNWILDFIRENFKILDDFEIGGERYIVLRKRD